MNFSPVFIRRKALSSAFLALFLFLGVLLPSAHADSSLSSTASAPKNLSPETAQVFLDEFFNSQQALSHYVGASVIIVKDGKVIAEKGYGYSNLQEKTPVDPKKTAFRIASVSKTFTSIAIMQLVEQGEIGLKNDFQTYVPGLKFDNPYDTPVTIENLLTHTTGFEIRDPKAEDIHADFDKYISIEDYVQEHMPPVVREPGSSYMYDNFASLLLGLVVQNVSGEPFETYMQKHIFEPLDMQNSDFMLTDKFKNQLSIAYDAARNPIDLYALSPAPMPQGGMMSTAEDIGKFMIAFLNGGSDGKNRILNEATVTSMETYRSEVHPLLPDTTYGFESPFQIPGAGSSSKIITKAGDIIGFSSYLFLIPEQNTGVFLTYNQAGALRNLFYPAFISAFFPEYAEPAKFDHYEPQTAEELQRYAGLYSDLRLKTIVSKLADADDQAGKMEISDAFIGSRTLIQVDDNLFMDELSGQFTGFKENTDGTIYMKEPYLNPFGYEKKGVKAAGYKDVRPGSTYATFIYGLQSLGHYSNDASIYFHPRNAVTRAEFIEEILELSGIPQSKTPPKTDSDWATHSAAGYIQAGYEMGMIEGADQKLFKPDQVITRQEAAVMIWRIYKQQYPDQLFSNVKLSGKTDTWAVPAVQMMIGLGLYGPEVKLQGNGSANYQSTKPLIRQEAAALMYQLLTQPTDQIVAGLAKEQENTQADSKATN
ncbi:serine hydrolase [Paenibacillus gallinarum]|uniref:Serine hydrolase n=1 Tax=Paenibacillus gallinarum TaxID=2762232 RepID=A0ABR8SY93_9BACL|nr:serine hydrolase [Paenibacillus gallinarum]MBD7968481.1 serine hydrolase [Paenibacillus gallinarum]